MPVKIPKPDERMEFWYEVRDGRFTLYERDEKQYVDLGEARNALSTVAQVSSKGGLESAAVNVLSKLEYEGRPPTVFVAHEIHSKRTIFGGYDHKKKSFKGTFRVHDPETSKSR